MSSIARPQAVLDFWFIDLGRDAWFAKSDAVDARIKDRFEATHIAACACELSHWRVDAVGRLAEIIVLDQFSRNLYRDSARAFFADPMALALAQEAIDRGFDQKLLIEQRAFLYMPFMHSESPLIHARAVELFSAPGLEFHLEFERKHKAIIDRFGRYPHRNALLMRASSAEEIAFLETPGSSF
jgi:uncharacterized protein (DUF924 family)